MSAQDLGQFGIEKCQKSPTADVKVAVVQVACVVVVARYAEVILVRTLALTVESLVYHPVKEQGRAQG